MVNSPSTGSRWMRARASPLASERSAASLDEGRVGGSSDEEAHPELVVGSEITVDVVDENEHAHGAAGPDLQRAQARGAVARPCDRRRCRVRVGGESRDEAGGVTDVDRHGDGLVEDLVGSGVAGGIGSGLLSDREEKNMFSLLMMPCAAVSEWPIGPAPQGTKLHTHDDLGYRATEYCGSGWSTTTDRRSGALNGCWNRNRTWNSCARRAPSTNYSRTRNCRTKVWIS